MGNQIYTYSLIKSLFDDGSDYIDSFLPIVLTKIPHDGKKIKINLLQRIMSEQLGLGIPFHSLSIIINRGKSKGLIERESSTINLTKKGQNNLLNKESSREVDRRINELISGILDFVNQYEDLNTDHESIKDALNCIIDQNIELFEIIFSPEFKDLPAELKELPADHSGSLSRGTNGTDRVLKSHIYKFLVKIENENDKLFCTFKDLIFGSLISKSVYSGSFGSIGESFEKVDIYLDTNFLLSLFGLTYDEESRPVKELYEMIKGPNVFRVKVFDFTLQEMFRVLNSYRRKCKDYLPDVKVGSIYGSLKEKGWAASDVVNFVTNIDKIIQEKGISIVSTGVKLNSIECDDSEVLELLNYKRTQSSLGQKHDIIAIRKVKEARAGNVRSLEKSKAIFLTSDYKLAKYNYETSHKFSGTISEVIPDRLLTNVLWLKQGADSGIIPISTLISSYALGDIIDKSIWLSFLELVRELRGSGKIEDSDISSLIYDNGFKGFLSEFYNAQECNSEEELVLSKINQKKIEAKRKKDSLLEKHGQELIDRDEEITDLECNVEKMSKKIEEIEEESITRESKILEDIDNVQEKCRALARKDTSRLGILLIILSIELVVVLSYVASKYICNSWAVLEPYTFVVALAFALICWILKTRYSWDDIVSGFSDRYYSKRLNTRIRKNESELTKLKNYLS